MTCFTKRSRRLSAGRRCCSFISLLLLGPPVASSIPLGATVGSLAESRQREPAPPTPHPEAEAVCPIFEPATCQEEEGQRIFWELWAAKTKCWLCTEVSEDLVRTSVPLIKDLASKNLLFSPQLGLQITESWLSTCLPIYLLAMVASCRAAILQPWVLYQFGLNVIATCRYNDSDFFRRYGVTATQIAYLFALIGQPYDETPQVADIQRPERTSSGKAPSQSQQLWSWTLPLVIDIGMGLGADTRYYLRQGFRVVGVEANPAAIEAALTDPSTKPYLLSGQLIVLNAAIAAPNSSEAEMPFWVIPQRPEQSKAQGWLALDGGVEASIRTVRCANLLHVFGEAVYMKIDVEFNTVDCLASLAEEAKMARRLPKDGSSSSDNDNDNDNGASGGFWRPPKYISAEVENAGLIGIFNEHLLELGYTHYKVTRQFIYSPGPCEQGYYQTELLGCGSGPFGESAVDYQVGVDWKEMKDLLQDTAFLVEFENGYDWFDLHAKRAD